MAAKGSVERTSFDGFPDTSEIAEVVLASAASTIASHKSVDSHPLVRFSELKRNQDVLSLLGACLDIAASIVVAIDANGDILLLNRNGGRILRCDCDQIVGKNWFDAFVPSRIRTKIREVFSQLMAGRITPVEYFENPIVTTLGDERIIRWHNSILHDEAGKIVGTLSTGEDITERKSDEKRLRLLSSIVEQVIEGIAVVDMDGKVLFVNQAFAMMHGYEPAEVQGKHLSIFHAGDQMVGVNKAIKQTEDAGLFIGEVWHVRRDGTAFPALMQVSLLCDESGRPVGLVGTMTDVTDRKRAEEESRSLHEQLHQAQKMEAVGELAAGVAHDFNNLLTVISIAAGALHAESAAVPAIAEKVALIREATQQASAVTLSLLTFSRKVSAHKSCVDFRAVIRKSAWLLHGMLRASVELVLDIPEGVPIWVMADATQIQQAVMNLAVNARDAMPEGGQLRIAVARVLEEVRSRPEAFPAGTAFARLSVSDTGIGMSPEVRAKLFDPFFSTKPQGHGTGLGLPIVQSIVKDHRGRIDVESEELRGTTFTITLPIVPAEEVVREQEGSTSLTLGRGETILLAEDNHFVRQAMVSQLEEIGYRVQQAFDGAALLDVCRQQADAVRLLIVDADLPRRSGRQCIQALRAEGVLTPAILMTGRLDMELEQGLDEHTHLMRKPFEMTALSRLASRLLSDRRGEAASEKVR